MDHHQRGSWAFRIGKGCPVEDMLAVIPFVGLLCMTGMKFNHSGLLEPPIGVFQERPEVRRFSQHLAGG